MLIFNDTFFYGDDRGKVARKREEIDNCMDKRISLYPSLIIHVYIL
jgi:hypothetical protein